MQSTCAIFYECVTILYVIIHRYHNQDEIEETIFLSAFLSDMVDDFTKFNTFVLSSSC